MLRSIQRPMPFSYRVDPSPNIDALSGPYPIQESGRIPLPLMGGGSNSLSKTTQHAIQEWFAVDYTNQVDISNLRDVALLEDSAKVLIEIGLQRYIRIEQIETADRSGVVVRLTSTRSKETMKMYFRYNGSKLDLVAKDIVVAQIPIEGLPIVALLLLSAFLTANIAIATRRTHARGHKRGNDTQSTDTCPRDPNNGNFSFGHDLVCTFPYEGVVTEDGRIYFYVFCLFTVEKIEINAIDCCKKHDIKLWCSESNMGAAGADELVLECFSSAIINQTLSKLSPACGWFIGGYAQVLVIATTLYAVLAVLVAWWVNFFHSETLIGYGGRNRDSCLCGGNVPTSFCSDRCRDACAAAGKKADCGNCSWACDYDIETGKALGYKHIPPKNGMPCCPGTETWCLPKPIKPLEWVCPDRGKGCFDCKYVCDVCYEYHWKFCPNPGVGKIRLDKADNVPCCKGTPRRVQPGFCDPRTNDVDDVESPVV